MGSQTPTSEIIVLKTANGNDTHDTGDATPATYLDNYFQDHILNLHAPKTEYSAKQARFGERESQVNDPPHRQYENDDVEDQIRDRYAPVPGLYRKKVLCVEKLLLESRIEWGALKKVGENSTPEPNQTER